MSRVCLSKITKKFSSNAILKGYRVIDASRILVGSHACLSLADMGAEVIKVE
jgi:crotonobetainyl-CoA:carnitine CoA-transferase CaiB-like acyl-CoA transferase